MKNDIKKKELDSFDQKLQDFENRVKKPQNSSRIHMSEEDKTLWKFVFRAGTELFSAFVVGVFIGFGLDYWLSTRPVFIIIFSILGMSAGVLNVWRIMKPNDINEK